MLVGLTRAVDCLTGSSGVVRTAIGFGCVDAINTLKHADTLASNLRCRIKALTALSNLRSAIA